MPAMLAMLVVLAPLPAAAATKCEISKIADLPATMLDRRPIVTAKINGVDAMFIADSGAFYSMISPAAATEFSLKTYPAPYGLRVTGMGGQADVTVTRVKTFTLAGVPIPNIEFLVGGSEVGSGSVGVLGQNVFSIGDVEYDLANGVIRLIHEDDCRKVNLAYWVGAGAPYSVMDIQTTTPMSRHTLGSAIVNGLKIRVLFDTGAYASVLSKRAAERAGIDMNAPGVTYAGYSSGIGREQVKTWIVPVASFKIGDEEIRNTHLRIGETVTDIADMLIGTDFFLSHHLYVASKQHRLFFTYNGGPVFNLASNAAPKPGSGPTPAADAPGSDAAGPDAAPPAVSAGDAGGPIGPGEPKDAAEFSRRGTAFAGRRDFEHALADLTRACKLAPTVPDYFYERGIAYRDSRQPQPARGDFDRVIELEPEHVPARLARAELRFAAHDVAGALEDLDAADRFAAKEANARLRMAAVYFGADRLPQAINQLDSWLAAHAADAGVPGALRERCAARALAGQDLSKALDDCNGALKRTSKDDPAQAHILSDRGLVRLRLGDYDKSMVDYQESLKRLPKNPWALYGLGADEKRRGKIADADSDMAAAAALWPPIGEAFAKHGINP
jgi:tetratricopeptide (TPR) repeat protein/predicted aspartyl protease